MRVNRVASGSLYICVTSDVYWRPKLAIRPNGDKNTIVGAAVIEGGFG